MVDDQLILLLVKLIMGFFASVAAVFLWSRTREVSWLFIVLGTLFLYGEIIFSTLELFGLSGMYLYTVYGISLIDFVFALFPFLFFTIGFVLFFTNKIRRL